MLSKNEARVVNFGKEGLGVSETRREFTSAGTLVITLVEYFNSILYMRASMMVETGSSAVGRGLLEKSTIFSHK